MVCRRIGGLPWREGQEEEINLVSDVCVAMGLERGICRRSRIEVCGETTPMGEGVRSGARSVGALVDNTRQLSQGGRQEEVVGRDEQAVSQRVLNQQRGPP